MQYYIYEQAEETLDRKMATLQRKFEKNGATLVYNKVGEKFEKTNNGNYDRFIIVDIEGSYRIADYIIIGKVDAGVELENVVTCYNNQYFDSIAKYQHMPIFCDHCKTNAMRKHSYILLNTKTNETMQVGSSCLKDFLGVSAEIYGFLHSTIDEIVKEYGCGSGNSFRGRYIHTIKVLEIGLQIVKKYGYVPTTRFDGYECLSIPEATSKAVKAIIDEEKPHAQYSDFRYEASDKETEQERKELVQFINNLTDIDNNFIANAKLLINHEYVPYEKIGILIGCIAYKSKYEAEQKRLAGLTSEWVGNIGDRIEITNCSITTLTSYETEFGITHVVKIVSNGNTFIWKTSKFVTEEEARKIKATIKDHTEYNSEKQTVITRAKIIE